MVRYPFAWSTEQRGTFRFCPTPRRLSKRRSGQRSGSDRDARKEVLRLRFGLGLTQEEIRRSCNIAQPTVHRYLERAAAAGLSWPLPADTDDRELEAQLFPTSSGREPQTIRPMPDLAAINQQLQANKHVTLQLLWEEYREAHPNGYSYSRLCERETEEALRLLPDGAFRLFMWICLRADRSTGSLPLDTQQIARLLGKTTDEILRDLCELVRFGVCRVVFERIIVQERFWPYERSAADDPSLPAFVVAIKRAFLSHACVASVFTAADERLAREWELRNIPVATVEHAIVLGVARKYTALLQHGAGTPITSSRLLRRHSSRGRTCACQRRVLGLRGA